MIVGAIVPASGRYAVQGEQVRAGLTLWARRSGARLVMADDGSAPQRAASLTLELLESCDLVLGPYGSDSVRAVATAGVSAPVWNHGGAADDVQRLPRVVSVPAPASRYLVALARAVASLRPGCTIALAIARGAFARFAREGLERAAAGLGVTIANVFALTGDPALAGVKDVEAVLVCGPVEQEIALLRGLRREHPSLLLGGVSPGIRAFPALLGSDPDGFLAPCQWHPALTGLPDLGPSTAGVLADCRALGLGPPDYVAAQAYACALIAACCRELSAEDPHAAARALRVSTFFGNFALDPETGMQAGHRLCVVRWRGSEQELL